MRESRLVALTLIAVSFGRHVGGLNLPGFSPGFLPMDSSDEGSREGPLDGGPDDEMDGGAPVLRDIQARRRIRPVPHSAIQVVKAERKMLQVAEDVFDWLDSVMGDFTGLRSLMGNQLYSATRPGLRKKLMRQVARVDAAIGDLQNIFADGQRQFRSILEEAVNGSLKPGPAAHNKLDAALDKLAKVLHGSLKKLNETKNSAYELLRSTEFSPGELLRDSLSLDLPAVETAIDVVAGEEDTGEGHGRKPPTREDFRPHATEEPESDDDSGESGRVN